jgi:HK97 family phage portal protein
MRRTFKEWRARIGAQLKTYFNQGNWIDGNSPGRIYSSRGGKFYWIPGTRFNWDRLTGDLWTCPAVQACLNIIHRNLPQAPWVVRKRQMSGKQEKWVPAAGHPLQALLDRPNDIYDGNILKQNIADSLKLDGNAYIIKERDGAQRVRELWWVPCSWVDPFTAPSSKIIMGVDMYRVTWGNQRMDVKPENMIHLRDGSDQNDPRLGLSELASAARDVNTLQQIATYKPNVLRNMGIIGKFISPKDNTVQIDPKEVKEHIDAQSTQDNVGSTVVVDFAAEIEYPNSSPKDLDIGLMGDMPEANICALMGVPAQVVGLHVGRLSKTFSNVKEAREQLWEECLIPLGTLISCQLGYDLLREFAGTNNPEQLEAYFAEYRLEFDYTGVRPLQPDLDALNKRELDIYINDGQTLGEFCANTMRQEPRLELKDLYYSEVKRLMNPAPVEPAMPGEQPAAAQEEQPKSNGKSVWEARIEAELEELERLHAGSEFAAAGNGVHA